MSVVEAESSLFAAVMDALLVLAGVVIACWLSNTEWDYTWSFIAVCGISSCYLIAQGTRLYRSWRIVALRRELGAVCLTWCFSGLAIFIVALFNPPFHDDAAVLMLWFVIALGLLSSWRVIAYIVMWEARRHGFNTRKVAIVGYNDLGRKLAETIEGVEWKGLHFAGFYEDRVPADGRTAGFADGDAIVGDLSRLHDDARGGRIDLIYITLPLRAEGRIREIIEKLADSVISVYVVPGNFTYDMLHPQLTTLGELPVIGVCETPYYGIRRLVKRAEDLVIGSVLLAMAAVPMMVIGVAIKLTSPGPVMFKQRRGGVNGEVITVWKFRTMTTCEDGAEVIQATRSDARVTPIGRILRRTSLDELPQLINVLQGDMSIVGPRPHALTHNDHYGPLIRRYMLRHKVKPGMTGWAQINGWRGETDMLTKMEKRVEFDLQYINNWSLLFDLKIVALTPLILMRNKDVY
ncbi:MAG: undecaprenyl-phosphate glucose phosphotransferase [Gammaproteobacteria bacterium]|jgi:putative colanic acid biosynthesis UDP-glucose lipid carrier transferase|nr:undecaprenyl-phosphate glucose phosphotransferase [Gammaproteobacteria bacterium]